MAFTANTVKPVRALRMIFGGMIPPPVKDFPMADTSQAVYEGNAFQFVDPPVGTVQICDGTAGQGVPGTGIPAATKTGNGFVGFAIGASAAAPPFITSTGAASGGLIMTSPSSVTANDPIPANEKIKLVLAIPGIVVFYGHLCDSSGGNEVDYSSTDRNDLGKVYALSVSVTAADHLVCFLDKTLTDNANAIAQPIDWAYPQGVPAARSTTNPGNDLWALSGTGDTNPAVEFLVTASAFSGTATAA